MTDLTDLGVKAIRDGVAGGEFTAREAAEAFNANVAAASQLNAFIVATPEKALEAADRVDADRAAGKPLATVPRIGRTWQQLLDEGFLLVATGSEIYYYREAVKRLREDWRTYSGEGAAATAAGKGGYGG